MHQQRVCVVNLGCRVNRVESDKITSELSRAGYEIVEESEADLVVINTCAVTGEAEAKTRKAVRHAAGLPGEPLVVVTGCVVNLNADELTSLSPRVVAEPSKPSVPARVRELIGDPAPGAGESCGLGLSDLLGRSRLGVKIQDGCNHRCTYCIVWKARGPERSVPLEDVLTQVREASASGVPEVVLTGVNLGAYRAIVDGAPIGIDRLLDEVLLRTDIPHVRISSIEPMDVSMPLIERMAASPDRVAPFLHLPIQSGCTETLRRMGRPYTAESFLELTRRIREVLPAASLSCDLIVGFPGETDEEFERSLALCEQVGFSRMHVFRYSKRPGTPAAAAPGQVSPEVMAQRSARARALAARMAARDAEGRIGTIERCVIEAPGWGTLGSFHKVVLDDLSAGFSRPFVDVELLSIDSEGVLHGGVRGDG